MEAMETERNTLLAQVPSSPTPAPTQQREVMRTTTKMYHDTPLKAPTQVGDPKRQRAIEAELGSGGPTTKSPRMMVS